MIQVIHEKRSSPSLLNTLACIQKAAFPYSLSSKLGLLYLKKNISWYLNSPTCNLITLNFENSIVGFMGTYERKNQNIPGSTNQILRYSIGEALFCSLIHPTTFFKKKYFLKSLYFWNFLKQYFFKAHTQSASRTDFKPYLGLVVIAIHPDYQNKGFGKLLLREFDNIAISKGYKYAKLTVDSDNLPANSAYQKAGWIIEAKTINSINYYKQF